MLFVGKYGLGDTAGNAVAVRRLIAAFGERGVQARYVQSGGAVSEAAFALFGFTPTVIHALHAGTAAKLGRELADAIGVPLVITVTGTDLNTPDSAGNPASQRLGGADAVVALTEAQLEQLEAVAFNKPVVRIPQAVELGTESFELREALALAACSVLAAKRIALLAGGLRPVKDQLFALTAFEQAGDQLADWLLVLAGPVLDADYADEVRARARALPNAVYIGEVPHEAMPAAISACDVVLNSSESEGEPQILLEAQCQSVPVVARRVVGNIALVEHGVTGWLFDEPSGLAAILSDLAQHPERLADAAAQAFGARKDRLNVDVEADAHLALYGEVQRVCPAD